MFARYVKLAKEERMSHINYHRRGDYMQDKPSIARKYRDMIAEYPADSEKIERILGKMFKEMGQVYRYRNSNHFDLSFQDGVEHGRNNRHSLCEFGLRMGESCAY